MKILNSFSLFVGNFCLPGSGSTTFAFLDPDPQPCLRLSPFLIILIVNINALPYFGNRNQVYESHNIFEESASKLRKRSKLGRLRYFFVPLKGTVS
jgi:hypothetical protein